MVSYIYKMFSLVLLCLLSIVCANDSSRTDNSNGCQTPDYIPGICIPVTDCSFIMDILRKNPITPETQEKLRSYQCGFDNKTPKVCCPHKNSKMINQKNCGISNGDKIFGGIEINPAQYPWTVLISYNTEIGNQFLCGGSIINENYILTSAHCIQNLRPQHKLMGVRLGEYDISKHIDCFETFPEDCNPPVQDITVSEIIPHPNYDSVTLDNNIGLLRLSTPANFLSDSVSPICLPVVSDNVDFIKSEVFVTGWGANYLAYPSIRLRRDRYKIVSMEECQRNYSEIAPQIKIGNNQICLQETETGNNKIEYCIGERGDPAHNINLIQQNNYANVQLGIISFSSKLCENSNQPKVLTKVAPYINWILDNMKP